MEGRDSNIRGVMDRDNRIERSNSWGFPDLKTWIYKLKECTGSHPDRFINLFVKYLMSSYCMPNTGVGADTNR